MLFISKIITSNKKNHICAPVSGKIIHLQNVPDKAFSNKLIGDGLAIEVSSNCICAPCQGKISVIALTKHAFGILTPDGVEILVHIGIQSLKPNAANYDYQIKVGDLVKVGTPIVTLSEELLKKHNYKKSFKKKAHLIKEEKAKAYSDGEFFELLEREGL